MIEKGIKILAAVVAIVLVVSLTMTALGAMTWRFFWIVAIAAAVMAYYVIPALREKTEGPSC
jgi:hypothetical protein